MLYFFYCCAVHGHDHSVLLNEYEMIPMGDFPKDDLAGMVVGPIGPCMMKYKRKVPLTEEEIAALKQKAEEVERQSVSSSTILTFVHHHPCVYSSNNLT